MKRYFQNPRIFTVLVIPFFKPILFQYISELYILEDIYIFWKILAAGFILSFFGLCILSSNRIPKMVLAIGIFELSILLSTFVYWGDISRALIDTISMISYTAFLVLSIKWDHVFTLRMLKKIMCILMLINLGSMILFPNGIPADLYHNQENALYFMTNDNGSTLFLIFVMTLILLDGQVNRKNRNYKNGILLFSSFLSALLSRSATAIVSLTLLLFGLFVIKKSKRIWKAMPKIIFILYMMLLLYLFTLQDSAVMEYVMTHILHRSGTFTGRYELWRTAWKMIGSQPWLGYGRLNHDYIAAWGGYFSSHNMIIEILLQGGMIALIAFASLMNIVIQRMRIAFFNKLAVCMALALAVILTAALMEAAVHSVYIFGLFIISYYSIELIEEEAIKKDGGENCIECHRSDL